MTAASAARACPVCGQDDATVWLQKNALRLVRCRRCAMIYANPVPTALASGQYYDQGGADYYLSPAKLESDYAPVRYERELRLFRRHCRGGAVLDVGCSSGAFLFQLGRRFPGDYQGLGTDVSGPALDYAEQRGVAVRRGSFLELDFGGRLFDAVTFWAVLEHLLEPARFLAQAASLLKPDGLCFVLVPNMKSLAARLLGARYRYLYPQHLNYFTKATLMKLVAPCFSVITFHTTHFNPIIVWQDWRGGGRDVSPRERAQLLQRTTAAKQHPLLRPMKALYGLTENALAALTLADNLAVVLRRREAREAESSPQPDWFASTGREG
ncbi:MAG TPA: class I SAM-dependent methyltransferase [Verrucomicrobiota bacterium]|nr:MAG: putative S-adenosylmethionine-dependent methyltransferase [Verrucomicrobia bacterium ADurb.Bin063]HOC50086.1 class I SAM-dependent methyltransferase [Verrucomicrobiota bacterium]HPI64597.1 class I SAM-dependent methyltransferase [Verrucomicrobiota bacterium]